MELQNIVFLVVLLAAAGLFAKSSSRLVKYLSVAKDENRFDRPLRRIWQVLVIAIGQKKILRDKSAGMIHAAIFWGFLILLGSAVEAILEGLNHEWSLNFLGPVYSAMTVLTDLFCLFIIVATLGALYRRTVVKVKRLQISKEESLEANLILLTIFTIVTSLLISNAERIALGTDFSWAVRPVGEMLAGVLPAGTGGEIIFAVTWWLHILCILGFMNFLPYSKHLHVLTSVPNVYFSSLTPIANQLERIDFEDENLEQYGVNDIEDFSWKTILDGYTCTHCGRCTSVCPANQTGKVLDPRGIIVSIHERTMDKAPLILKQQNGEELTEEEQAVFDKKLVGDYIDPEALWACTTCGACMQECPVMIEHVPAIVGMRRSQVMMEAEFPQEVQPAFSNMENNGSPWAFSQAERADWTEGMEVPIASETQEFDVLFWVGCAGSFDDRAKKVSRAFAELMNLAGVKYAILGTEEQCTGDSARRAGNEYLADMLTQANIETFERYNVKTIVATCPHCFSTLRNDYPQFGGNYEVIHHTQYIQKLVTSGKLDLHGTDVSEEAIAYHDSCYLGRYNDEYGAPRATLEHVPGLEIITNPRNRSKGFCCGAGGARMFMEETVGKPVNVERTEELLETGANTIAVNCPFCSTMITDGVKAKDRSEDVVVKDVAEIVLEKIQPH